MPTPFRPYCPDQVMLLPPDIKDWLPENHLAHPVSELVETMDLSVFYAPYEEDGRRKSPYEPWMMLKILIYGYATGVFSSRGIARKLEEDVAFRVLAAGNFPNHRTINEFRRRHLADFKRLFVEVVRIAFELGVVNFGKLSIDGSKVRANASKRKAMSYARMQAEERRLESDVSELLGRAQAVDQSEDERLGQDGQGQELPEELHRRAGRTSGPTGSIKRKHRSTAPIPESRIMKTSTEGYQSCDNAQMAVDGAHQLIVSTQVLADAGYYDEVDLEQLDTLGGDSYMAGGREGRRQAMVNASQCPARARMAAKLETSAGRVQYAERKYLAEAPFGWIKQVMGFRQFSVRVLQKVLGEWDLVCQALNIKRMQGVWWPHDRDVTRWRVASSTDLTWACLSNRAAIPQSEAKKIHAKRQWLPC